jgi:hypothetical protein
MLQGGLAGFQRVGQLVPRAHDEIAGERQNRSSRRARCILLERFAERRERKRLRLDFRENAHAREAAHVSIQRRCVQPELGREVLGAPRPCREPAGEIQLCSDEHQPRGPIRGAHRDELCVRRQRRRSARHELLPLALLVWRRRTVDRERRLSQALADDAIQGMSPTTLLSVSSGNASTNSRYALNAACSSALGGGSPGMMSIRYGMRVSRVIS